MGEKEGLVFGTAGIPRTTKMSNTESGVKRILELGLGCLEVEFVRGVKMKKEKALLVRKIASQAGIRLTAHASYFVNLNARENEKVDASKERILKAAYISSFFNGEGVVFHPAFYLGDDPSKVYITVKRNLEEIAKRLREEEIKVLLRPETTGKATQFGTLDEILRLSNEVDGVAPCIDFAHLHARTGKINSHQEFIDVLDQIEDKLGKEGLENMHIHISGIEYGNRGEKKHLNLEESDIHYIELIRALKIRKVKGVVICESPNLEEDALLLKNTYEKL